tara:strand:- start:642 stop:1043 length:402 start_codon:yes stop_codon:yes gene_type:complete
MRLEGTVLAVIIVAGVFLGSCMEQNEHTKTLTFLGSLGHENGHCHYGQYHKPDGTIPITFDATDITRNMFYVNLVVLDDARLQQVYKDAINLSNSVNLDNNVAEVNAFNIWDGNKNLCTEFISRNPKTSRSAG